MSKNKIVFPGLSEYERKQYELKINELEAQLNWLKDMNSGLIKLSLDVIRLHKDEESGEE